MLQAKRSLYWLTMASWPTPLHAQHLAGGDDALDTSIVRVLAAILICVAAAVALALVIRARGKPATPLGRNWLPGVIAGSRRIEIVEARRVSSFADVCLIRCDGTEYLLLCGASGQQVLERSPLYETRAIPRAEA